jgi:hypothetical protein
MSDLSSLLKLVFMSSFNLVFMSDFTSSFNLVFMSSSLFILISFFNLVFMSDFTSNLKLTSISPYIIALNMIKDRAVMKQNRRKNNLPISRQSTFASSEEMEIVDRISMWDFI